MIPWDATYVNKMSYIPLGPIKGPLRSRKPSHTHNPHKLALIPICTLILLKFIICLSTLYINTSTINFEALKTQSE